MKSNHNPHLFDRTRARLTTWFDALDAARLPYLVGKDRVRIPLDLRTSHGSLTLELRTDVGPALLLPWHGMAAAMAVHNDSPHFVQREDQLANWTDTDLQTLLFWLDEALSQAQRASDPS
ncbi:MAG: hypothetical protein AB7K09_16310 [Planctomycetota bacterium]